MTKKVVFLRLFLLVLLGVVLLSSLAACTDPTGLFGSTSSSKGSGAGVHVSKSGVPREGGSKSGDGGSHSGGGSSSSGSHSGAGSLFGGGFPFGSGPSHHGKGG